MQEPKIYYRDDDNKVEIKILRHNAEHDTFLIQFPNERIVECAPKELIFPTDVEIKEYYTSTTSHVHVINPETKPKENMEKNRLGLDPAFPMANPLNEYELGISKRFYAACAAMQGFIKAFYGSNESFINLRNFSENKNIDDKTSVSIMAYEYADEMLKQEYNEE